MRIFGLSDVHVDYDVNRRWIEDLSASDYQDDLLILAGDVSDSRALLEQCLTTLARRFARVRWVVRRRRDRADRRPGGLARCPPAAAAFP